MAVCEVPSRKAVSKSVSKSGFPFTSGASTVQTSISPSQSSCSSLSALVYASGLSGLPSSGSYNHIVVLDVLSACTAALPTNTVNASNNATKGSCLLNFTILLLFKCSLSGWLAPFKRFVNPALRQSVKGSRFNLRFYPSLACKPLRGTRLSTVVICRVSYAQRPYTDIIIGRQPTAAAPFCLVVCMFRWCSTAPAIAMAARLMFTQK